MAAKLYIRIVKTAFLSGVVTFLLLGIAIADEKGSDWSVSCGDEKNAQTCRMEQKLFAQKEVDGQQQTIGKVLSLTILYVGKDSREPVLVMDLPLGVDLRPGMVLRIDGGKETNAPYLQCTKNGCSSNLRLTSQMVNTLRRGLMLQVGFRPWGSPKLMTVEASLKGFSAAFARLR